MGEVVQFIPKANPERLQKAFEAVCKELTGLVPKSPITDHKEYPQEPA